MERSQYLTEIKCSVELQEVKTQIWKTEARIFYLESEEVPYQRKLEEKSNTKKREEREIEEELRQLAQSKKKNEERKGIQAKLMENQREEAPCQDERGTELILRKEKRRGFKAIS
ncbi:hypothetical protein NPIL_265381 [Nephila pilipes]|uniref:Uncharacterized protein n=1 Tax=Nephila pilipes TaxID=299642 RepID=A0A8X6PPV1_NEPPI|nr:hypothetical protein NPIL_265381 [Nephila pilipes]